MKRDPVQDQVSEIHSAVHDLLGHMMGLPVKNGGLSVDERITRLENRMDRVEAGLASLRTEVSVLAERINHLPTKELMVKCAIGTVLAIGAIMTFAEKLQALVR